MHLAQTIHISSSKAKKQKKKNCIRNSKAAHRMAILFLLFHIAVRWTQSLRYMKTYVAHIQTNRIVNVEKWTLHRNKNTNSFIVDFPVELFEMYEEKMKRFARTYDIKRVCATAASLLLTISKLKFIFYEFFSIIFIFRCYRVDLFFLNLPILPLADLGVWVCIAKTKSCCTEMFTQRCTFFHITIILNDEQQQPFVFFSWGIVIFFASFPINNEINCVGP